MSKPEEINNFQPKDNVKIDQKLSENDEYVLSEWQAPKNKTGFFIFLVSSMNFLKKNSFLYPNETQKNI